MEATQTAMDPTDIQLMLRVRDGDAVAFQELVGRYRGPLRGFFAALLPDPSLAEDYVQETLMRLWLSRERYEPTGVFSTYLFQIGKHYWFNQRTKVRAEVPLEVLEEGGMEVRAPRTSQPEMVLLRRHSEARMRRAIAALPEHYRSVFMMSHFDGLKYAEIAGRLGIPVGTVKSRMAEAVRRLRCALMGDGDETREETQEGE